VSGEGRIAWGLALVAAVGAIVAGLWAGVPALESFWRAALAAVAGYLAGWLIFGRFGTSVVREAAGEKDGRARKERAAPPTGT